MAWRIHESVSRGEIDNRERGHIRGKLWIHGRAEPVRLFLIGNGHRDLAGCLLTFETNQPTIALADDGLTSMQEGTAGDFTASRKVREFEIPIGEALARTRQGLSVPEHLANCVYLEWFSQTNGRVVIEGTHFSIQISPPSWTLSEADELARRKQAEKGFESFVKQLAEAVRATRREPGSEAKEWDEFDYERMLRQSDARNRKFGELIDKYREHPDRNRIVAMEMGWNWLVDAIEEQDPRSVGNHAHLASAAWDDQSDTAEDVPPLKPDPHTEGKDWVRDKDQAIRHPLCARAFHGAMGLWHRCSRLELNGVQDPDLRELHAEYQITGAKLAGALNRLAYGRDFVDGPFIVACLKRSLGHLHHALTALERVAPRELLPRDLTISTRAELLSIREDILHLMTEFRSHRP